MKVQTISDQLLFSTIRIEITTDGGKIGVGTGCIIAKKIDDHQSAIFLVTNKHVVERAKTGRMFFIKKENDNPVLGHKLDVNFNNFEKRWNIHKEADLAILPFVPILEEVKRQTGSDAFFKAIPLDLVPTDEQAEDLDSLEEIIFIGYPIGLYDTKNLLPIIRRGITATPFFIDYNGEKKFLIDAAVFPGSSGSPVFVYNKGGYTDRKGNLTFGGDRIIFCGIISETYYIDDYGETKNAKIPLQEKPIIYSRQMINLGVVIKSTLIKEFIEEFIEQLNSIK
jgi:hypothetical protein